MKRIGVGFLSLVMILLLVACNNNSTGNMIIRESEFSEETKEVLSLINDEMVFFDYKVDKSIKSMSTDIWTCDNEEWTNGGAVLGNVESSNRRLAIRINDLSYDIFSINKDGHTKSSHPIIVDFNDSNVVSNSRLDNPREIEANKEIPLWTRLGSNRNSNFFASLSDFRESECDTGLAITVTFYAKEVE